jgi:hypothetical protein
VSKGEIWVLASLTVGSVLLGLSALSIVLTLIAGTWLRECHDDLLEQQPSAVESLSRPGHLQRRWRSRGMRSLLPGPVARRVLARIITAGAFPLLASVPFMLVLAGAGLPQAMAAVRALVVVGLASAGAALWLFLRGVRCSGDPNGWGERRRLSFPDGVVARDRSRAVLNMYWSGKIPVGLAMGIAQVALVATALAVASSQPLPTIEAGDIVSSNSIVWIPIALALPIPPILIARVARRRLASASAIVEILRVLDLRERRAIILTPVRDPLWKERDSLGEIVALLRETARQLDTRQRREMSPHPISNLLRAAAEDIHRFLRSYQSLEERDGLPGDIRNTLILVLKVLVGPAEPETYKELNASVGAFDSGGAAVVKPVAKKERVTAAGYRVLNVLDQTSRVAPVVFWLVLVAALLIDGQTSIDELVNILK